MKVKKENKIHSLHIIILVAGIIIQFIFVLSVQREEIYREIDRDLYSGAASLKHYIGTDFVTKELNSESYTTGEMYDKAMVLHNMAIQQGLSYFYILIKDGDNIVYAVMSGDKEEILGLPQSGYWFSLKESEDDSFGETWEAFDSRTPIYLESSDIWGHYRSIYIPEISRDGRSYIAGADISIDSIRKQILIKSIKLFIPFIFLLIIVLPTIYFKREILKHKESMEKYIKDIDIRDKLTGAYTRDYGLKVLSKYIHRYHTTNRIFSIFLIDIDNLKSINKTRGTKSGDTLIIITHRILSSAFRKEDEVIRLEGNKFLIVLSDFNEKHTREVSELLETKCELFNRMNRRDLFIKLNYTMCQYSSGSVTELLEYARTNLRIESSKDNWKNKNLNEKIFKGIKSNEFKAYFQPKVYLKEKKVAFEALARWKTEEGETVSPADFIPIAEKSFLINEITKVVLKDALMLAKKLKVNISVNLSLVSFENNRFLNEIKGILLESQYSEYITFEITESLAITNIETTLSKMNKLLETGISFAIDDFGSGYSSLPYIEQLPINEIKIDRSFIQDLNNSQINQIIIEFVNKIATLKKYNVICEGTEEAEEIKKLMLLGNYSFQGYYFGRPESSDSVIKKYNDNIYLKKMEEFI